MKRLKKKALNKHQQEQFQIDVDPDDLPDIECLCGNKTFIQGKTIKKISEVHPANKAGEAQYLNIAAVICLKCYEPLPPKP